MTKKEAKRRIIQHIEIHSRKEPIFAVYISEALNMAISCIEAQIPKKPVPYFNDEYKCPICDTLVNLSSGYKQPFCYNCGQAIDWGETL